MQTADAHHGLATVAEFLSKCHLSSTLKPTRSSGFYQIQSVRSFKLALCERQELLGNNHPLVARTHHKLARSYTLSGDKKSAREHYKKAINIYDACGVDSKHPK